MTSVTLRNLGGSVVLAVPKKILDLVDLDAGSKVDDRREWPSDRGAAQEAKVYPGRVISSLPAL